MHSLGNNQKQEYQVFTGSGRKSARKTFHSLRHTVHSAIIASGGTEAQAEMILGHSPGQGKAYSHADVQSLGKVLVSALKGVC